MGTKGYVVFLLDEMYYIFYNDIKSYPSKLGVNIINNLTSLFSSNGYNYLLEYLKEKINKIPEYLKEKDETNGSASFGRILDVLSYPQNYIFKTTKDMPHCSDYIEWIYTIDLNNNKFLVENIDRVYTFDLAKIRASLFLENIKENLNINSTDSPIDISDDDTETDIKLKIDILENQNKINKLKLYNRKLNK